MNALFNLPIVVSALFIFGLKGSSGPPPRAVRGNMVSALGMLIAVVADPAAPGHRRIPVDPHRLRLMGGAIGASAPRW